MNPSWPDGTAVAVRDGRILEVGSMESLGPWLARDEHEIVDFGDAVILPGLIDNDSGCVSVTVIYQAIMLRPFKNEVLDTTIFNAADDSGFFARVGPLEIYIHKYNMPEDMRFDHTSGDSWVSEDGTIEIKDGSLVRLRIIGVSVDAGQMNAIGTIKDAYLGQLE